jgi:bla regulator protein BlaR1
MRLVLIVAALAWAAVALSAAQAETPRFEVVSVKPNDSPEPGGRNALEPGGYEGIGVTLRRMIALAYMPIPNDLIVGGPSWMNTDRFDVRARFAGSPPREQLQQMMRTMLAERFKLRTHLEMRPTRIFALMVERAGVLGQSLRPAEIDCANRAGRQPGQPWCSFQYTEGLLRGRGVTLDQIAGELDAGRIVVNRTGLAGRYDVDLRWTATPGAASDAADAPPGLATALREQLGLRLQPDTAPFEHLVIDSAERPEPD